MSLFLRAFQMLIASFFKKRIDDIWKKTKINFRVLPSDLDYYLHMNNSKYFTYGEICRVDFMIRSGFLKLALKKGYYTPIAYQQAHFKKPLKLFQKFKIESSLQVVDEKWFEFEHFFFSEEGSLLADIKVRLVIKRKDKTISTHQVVEELEKLKK